MNILNETSVYALGEDCATDLRTQLSKTIKIAFSFPFMTCCLCFVLLFNGSSCCYNSFKMQFGIFTIC